MGNGNPAWDGLVGLRDCLFDAADSGGAQCGLISEVDSGFGIALVFVLALNIGGVVLSYMALGMAAQLVESGAIRRRPVGVVLGIVSAVLWFYLWLGYALPESTGQNYVVWMVSTPLFTLVLMTGFVGMAAAVFYILGSLVLAQQPHKASSSGHPLVWASASRVVWGLLVAAVTGVLIGWRALYASNPEIAEGPFGRGPGWFQDALGVWTLHLPMSVLWELAKALATVPGIAAFALLGVLSVVLPRPGSAPEGGGATAMNWVSTLTTAAAGNIAGLVASTCVIIVVSLLAIAAAALAFMFFAAYVMAYVLVLSFFAVVVVKVVGD